MRYKVNKDKCIGCGMCVGITNGTVFDFDEDDNLAKANNDEINDETKDLAIEACNSCPVGAIEKEN